MSEDGSRRGRGAFLAVVVGLAAAAAMGTPRPASAQGGFCFPGRRDASCHVTGLVEAAVVTRFAGSNPVSNDEDRWEATWEVGALVRGDDGHGWGGTFLVGTGEYRPRLALKLRHRRWLDPDWTLDVGVGPMTHSTSVDDWGVGAMADVGFGYRDQAGAFARVEVLPTVGDGVATAGFLGARLGSWPAIAGSGAAGLLLFIALLTADFQ